MYQTTKMVTRRAAAKRAAEGDQENAAAPVPPAQEVPVVPLKQTAVQTRVTKRNALGDKNINQNVKPAAAGKNAKPVAKVPSGRVAIPARPANKTKAAACVPTAKPPNTRAPAAKSVKAVTSRATRSVLATKTSLQLGEENGTHTQEEVTVEAESEEVVAVGSSVVAANGDQLALKAVVATRKKTNVTKSTKKPTAMTAKKGKPAGPGAAAGKKHTTAKSDHEGEHSAACSDISGVYSPMDVDGSLQLEMSEEDLQFIAAQRKEDALEPSLVHEYSEEIFRYMRRLEEKMMPDPSYMDNQSEIQWEMRGVLIDWLVQVHGRFQMQNETLFLCVNFIDRFLSAKVVSVQKFQLVGVTALLLAAKFEEISAPSIADLVYMVDNGYDAEEIKKAERYMVQLLNFELGFPGPMSFLRRVSKADDYCQSTRTLAKYLIELTIMDEKFIGIVPSMIAAAGDMLARKFLKGSDGEWTPVHVHYAGYTALQLENVAAMIIERAMDPNSHQSIYDKYADVRYWKASIYVQQWFEKYGYQEKYFFPSARH